MKTKSVILLAVAFVFISGCKKEKAEACIDMVTGYNADTIFINDTVLFSLCNNYSSGLVICNWNFGDGTSGSGTSVKHAYQSTGRFTVSETVTSEGGTDFDSAHIIVLPHAIPADYMGTYQAKQTCAFDSTNYPVYSSNITSAGGNAIVIHNLLNTGVNINATVTGNKVSIPQQINSGDTVSGWGNLSFDKQTLNLAYTLNQNTPNRRICGLQLTR